MHRAQRQAQTHGSREHVNSSTLAFTYPTSRLRCKWVVLMDDLVSQYSKAGRYCRIGSQGTALGQLQGPRPETASNLASIKIFIWLGEACNTWPSTRSAGKRRQPLSTHLKRPQSPETACPRSQHCGRPSAMQCGAAQCDALHLHAVRCSEVQRRRRQSRPMCFYPSSPENAHGRLLCACFDHLAERDSSHLAKRSRQPLPERRPSRRRAPTGSPALVADPPRP